MRPTSSIYGSSNSGLLIMDGGINKVAVDNEKGRKIYHGQFKDAVTGNDRVFRIEHGHEY